MKIYNLNKLSFESSNSKSNYPKSGTLVKCRGQLGICYTYTTCGDNVCCKVYLLGANDLPYTTVTYSHKSCKEIDPPVGYTNEYGKRLCDAWSINPHEYSPEEIIFNERK